MRSWWPMAGVLLVLGVAARAEQATPLSLMQPWESVYAPPEFPSEEQGVNAGGMHLDLTISYLTDYYFRGLERFDAALGSEDAANLQYDGVATFDLGRLPHPFVGVFVNVAENDDVSNFQEIRPYLGVEWTLRPITLAVGHNTFIYPNRSDLDTSEGYARLTIDDTYFFRTDDPLLSPYVMAAYDYDLYDGWYIEAGVQHDFRIEDTGIVLTAQASVAYVRGIELFAGPRRDSGFHHAQFGLTGTYSLNNLLNIPRRYGEWSLKGYLFYTDGIDDDLRWDRGLWGGAGIGFTY